MKDRLSWLKSIPGNPTIKKAARAAIGLRNNTDFYSQGGEDAIVSNTFIHVLGISTGTYVDIGAYHPFRHSNTYVLYKSGWKGINIDPRPGVKKLFDKHRPGDVNIEAGIARSNGTMTYYMLDDASTMNSFSKENLDRLGIFDRVSRTIQIPVRSMSTLIDQYPLFERADYLNIDAEGMEMEILEGNDFARCSPSLISIEQNGVRTLEDVLTSSTAGLMKELGYVAFAKNVILSSVSTVFYLKDGLLGRLPVPLRSEGIHHELREKKEC